jgi:acyl carrier protein phosphodiesterase
MEESVNELKENYQEFELDFFDFFPDLQQHSKEYLSK